METEKEMVDRAISEVKYALKRNFKYIFGILLLIVIVIWVFMKFN